MENLLLLLLPPLLVVLAFQSTVVVRVGGDITSDQAECTNSLVGLATCLPYVQGNAKMPTPDCCKGLKGVLSKSPKCLCVLIKDRNDPNLGIKINVSLAMRLPDACSAPANISKCPELLKLPPNSPEAQIFEQPQKTLQGNSSISTMKGNSPSTSAHESNNGVSHHFGRREWLRVDKFGVSLCLLLVLPLMVF